MIRTKSGRLLGVALSTALLVGGCAHEQAYGAAETRSNVQANQLDGHAENGASGKPRGDIAELEARPKVSSVWDTTAGAGLPPTIRILRIADADIRQVAAHLSEHSGIRIDVPPNEDAPAKVALELEDIPLEETLTEIADAAGWVWWRGLDGRYGLASRGYFEQHLVSCGRPPTRVFRLTTMKASEFEKELRTLLTPQFGVAVADDRTNKVIVTDHAEVIAEIEKLFEGMEAVPREAKSVVPSDGAASFPVTPFCRGEVLAMGLVTAPAANLFLPEEVRVSAGDDPARWVTRPNRSDCSGVGG